MDERAVLINVFNFTDISRETVGVRWCESVQLLHPNSASFLGGSVTAASSDTLLCWFAPVTMATVETNYHLKARW